MITNGVVEGEGRRNGRGVRKGGNSGRCHGPFVAEVIAGGVVGNTDRSANTGRILDANGEHRPLQEPELLIGRVGAAFVGHRDAYRVGVGAVVLNV